MKVLPGPTKSNTVLAWSPCGRFVAAGGNGDGITVWDLVEGTPGQRVLGAAHGGEEMRFCPRTSRIYVAFRTGGVWTYDPNTGEERQRRPEHRYVGYSCPAVSADGRLVALHRYESGEWAIVGYAVADDGALSESWSRPDLGSIDSLARLLFTFRPHTDQLFGLRGMSTFEWSVARTGAVVGSFPLDTKTLPVAQWALAPDGDRVAWLAQYNLYVQRLDEPAPRVLPASGEYRRGLAWSPNGRTLAYTTGSAVRLLDADTLTEVRALDWNMGKARAVCFSPDGLRAAVSTEGGRGWVTVFDLE